ncbi:MAG: nucleotide exchange factor GrpE [Verrucomicrobiaceae bacterium]|nr:nucleotide exchange factor GrpE [Verrucomicrobiaceae bacterium]
MNQEETNISQQLTPDEVASQQRLAEDMASQEQQVDICLEPNVCNANDDDKLAQAEALAEKNKDLYLRAVADLDTYKRKVQREKSELAKFAMQPLVEELLPSLDHLEMAIQAAKMVEGGENIAMGVEMVQSNVKKVFASFGIEEISQVGGVFDPSKEDCVSQEASDVVPENSVIKVVRTGYIMNGRLLRPASVIVSSGKAK